jgi:hypothetical protein
MMKTQKLQNIAKIRTGYTFRKVESASESDGLLGLHISDTRDTTVVDPVKLSPVAWQGKGKPPVLEPGDVVLAAKGSHNRAVLFTSEGYAVIPSNQFMVLSVINAQQLLPEFLCWVLNYPATQTRLAESQAGSSMPSISKKALAELTVPVPELDVQQRILQLNSLWQDEVELTHKLLANRQTQVKGLFQKLLSGATPQDVGDKKQ